MTNPKHAAHPRPLFPLGQIVGTPGAISALETAGRTHSEFLDRHVCGDWGELSDDDKAENEYSLTRYLRIFSAYHLSAEVKIWIITEADRSSTTILLPSEY